MSTTQKPYATSELRQQLRKMGIRDEQMMFDDSPDGKAIIPWGFFDEDGEFHFSSRATAPAPQVETCASGDSPDNPGKSAAR